MPKTYWQIMSLKNLTTFGSYSAETPEEALEKWATATGWESWAEHCEVVGVSVKEFKVKDFRIYI